MIIQHCMTIYIHAGNEHIYCYHNFIFISDNYINLAVNSHTVSLFSSSNLWGGFTVVPVHDLVMITLGDLSCGVSGRLSFLLYSNHILAQLSVATIPSDITCWSLNDIRPQVSSDDAILPGNAFVSAVTQTFMFLLKSGNS